MTDNQHSVLTIIGVFAFLFLLIFGMKNMNKIFNKEESQTLNGNYVLTEKMKNDNIKLVNLKDNTVYYVDSTMSIHDSLFVKSINDTIKFNNNKIVK